MKTNLHLMSLVNQMNYALNYSNGKKMQLNANAPLDQSTLQLEGLLKWHRGLLHGMIVTIKMKDLHMQV